MKLHKKDFWQKYLEYIFKMISTLEHFEYKIPIGLTKIALKPTLQTC